MDEFGFFGALAFATFIFIGTITFLIVAHTQHLRDGASMVRKDYT